MYNFSEQIFFVSFLLPKKKKRENVSTMYSFVVLITFFRYNASLTKTLIDRAPTNETPK